MSSATLVRVPLQNTSDHSDSLGHKKDDEQQLPQPLKNRLITCGIRPFSRASVERYKRKKVAKHTPIRTKVFRGIYFGAILTEVLGIGLTLVHIGAGVALILLGFTMVLLVSKTELRKPSWKLISLCSFPLDQIPPHVRRTITTVQEQLPDTRFRVCELRLDTMILDPFLVVEDLDVDPESSDRFLYLEVWDENDF